MKKIILFSSFIIIYLSLTAFRGCMFDEHTPLGQLVTGMSGGQYDYGDNNAVIYYTISVGTNGTILRAQGTDNLVFQQMPSGTSQRLNGIRISNNRYQDDASAVGNNGTVLISTNAGVNWTSLNSGTTANLNGIDHSPYFYAVGDNGTILYSGSFGGSLAQQTSGTTRNLKAVTISVLTPQVTVAVGEKGTILRTSNTGYNWNNVSIPDTTFDFYAMSQRGIYFSSDVFVAVGSGGRIYKSTDLGETWQQKSSGTTSTLRSIYFHSSDSGVVVGDNGTVRLTTNGGETWFTNSNFNSPSSRSYKAVSLVYRNNKTFCAVSDTMFFASEEPLTVGIQPVTAEIPSEFSLSQNYPNPFNPSTKIRFELPKSSFTKLAVFDITGKEIETLVSENMHTGTYEYEWNAVNMPSGVYFYKLEADGFTETRKMILIK
jgi:photosystem II stability/assembly factor-like uncharacterized protein